MSVAYEGFLESKKVVARRAGIEVVASDVHPLLFPFQRDVVVWAVRKGQCAVFLDCVAGDTIINSPDGDERIDALVERAEPFRVWSLATDGRKTIAWAQFAFQKGTAPLYQFTLASGRCITVTQRHRFLTPDGWTCAGDLHCGAQLAVFAPAPDQSILDTSPLASHVDDRHCIETRADLTDRYFADSHLYDLPLHQVLDNDQASSLRQADAHVLYLPLLHKDAQEPTPRHNHHCLDTYPPSMLDCVAQGKNVVVDVQSLPQSNDYILTGGNTHNVPQIGANSILVQPTHEFHPLAELSSEVVQSETLLSSYDFDTLVSIHYIGENVYYDMYVPKYENYLANGIWNHNTGLGKTFVQLEWSRLLGQNTLIIAPLSVARQTVREGTKIGLDVRYVRDESQIDTQHNLWITNYELIDRFDFSVFGAVVLDECFVADTPVDTPVGSRPIQDIRPGDEVYTAVGIRKVKATHTRHKNSLVLTSIQGRDIISSENHPYLTRRGWVQAKNLKEGDYVIYTKEAMRVVREATSRTSSKVERTFLQQVLLGEMENEPGILQGENIYTRTTSKDNSENQILVEVGQSYSNSKQRANQIIESDIQSSNQREDIQETPRNGTQTLCARRKWEATSMGTASTLECPGERLDNRIRPESRQASDGISDLLQNRYCKHSSQDSYRGRWIQSCSSYQKRTGCEEGCQTQGARVDRVTIYKSDDPIFSRYCDSTGRVVLYDLEIEGHPSFSVHGLLVHNSSILKAIDGKTRKRLTDLCKDIPYRLCCTATPAPNDHTEIGQHAQFLGVCTMSEMIAMFFVNANKEHTFTYGDKMYHRKGQNKGGQEWRLKHHAEIPFFKWLSSWAITMMKPSDLGYDDDGFILPPLTIKPIFSNSDYESPDNLFFTHLHGIKQHIDVRRQAALTNLTECVRIISEGWNLTRGESCPTKILNRDAYICENTTYDTEMNNLPSKKQSENHLHLTRENEREYAIVNGISEIETQFSQKPKSIMPKIENAFASMVLNIENPTALTSKRAGSNDDTELNCESTKNYLRSSLENVQSVESHMTKLNGDCSLITTTTMAPFEDCCALDATMESVHSPMMLGDYILPSNISPGSLSKWVIWCGLDSEQDIVAKAFGDLCVSVSGKLSLDEKIRLEELWREGPVPIMITKAKIFGFGVNWQCAANMIFFGLSFSWETYYQCIRREWRYGQTHPVNVYILMSDNEAEVYQNVMRKDAMANRLREKLIEQIRTFEEIELERREAVTESYAEMTVKEENWTAMMGDSCKRLGEIATDSVSLAVFSPPFADLFTYSDSERDLGNSKGWDQFFEHYAFIIRETLRVTKPGRLNCVHTSDIPAMASRDGYIGVRDFPGAVIRAYETEGWTFVGRAFVQKNPQCLKDGTPVLTLDGWKPIESIELGLSVIGSGGKPTIVTDIPYRGMQPIYRVTFDDGAFIDCGPQHLWTVRTSRHNKWHTMSTLDLFVNGTKTPSGKLRYEIPSFKTWYAIAMHRIHSIEFIDQYAPCTCISVAAEDGLYVADNYVVTHNSQAIRVKSKALLFVQMRKDSASSRPALVDQILLFRKPGENAIPITPVDNGEMDNEKWIEWAHGIWLGIHETDTLQYAPARGVGDEKHIAPLQLGTIERCIKLYSNPGETVLTPFGGIGSEAVVALKLRRKAILIELKPEYFMTALKNMREIDDKANTPDLFSVSGITV